MTSLAAVPSIAEVEKLLAEIRELTNHVVTSKDDKLGPGIDQCWRQADVVAKARGGGGGGTPIAEHDPVGEYATDDGREEVYRALRSAAIGIRSALGQLKNARSGLQDPVEKQRQRVAMKRSQSFDHDTADHIAAEYARKPSPTFERYEGHAKAVGG